MFILEKIVKLFIFLNNLIDDGYKLTYLGYDYLALNVIIITKFENNIILKRHLWKEEMSKQ